MENKYSELWQAALGQLELENSKANFNTWIKTLSLDTISSNTAYLTTPNFMSKSYIEKKFLPQIVSVLKSLWPDVVKVKIVVKSNIVKKDTETLFDTQNTTHQLSSDNTPMAERTSTQDIGENSGNLSQGYTFSSFLVGSSNRVAFSAAQLVVEKPGNSYNPLFLYGPAGVGKTHLMWAISNEIVKNNPKAKTLYVTSEQIISEFVNAIRKGQKFTSKYREVDVLLVDDMQFIAGAEKTQEEFFHTFNSLHQNSKQIVLCSDRHPKEIPTLEERLRSRFEWGMVADIQPPDLETRVAIILSKAANQGVELDQKVAEYIAQTTDTNIRELEGALKKLIVFSKAHGSELTLELAEQALGNPNNRKKQITSRQIIERVSHYYNVKTSDILSSKRDKDIVLPRQTIMFVLRQDLSLSFPKIAEQLGGKDHTTIMYGVKKVEKRYNSDTHFKDEITKVREYIVS